MEARRKLQAGEAEAIFAALRAGETRRAVGDRFGRTAKAIARLTERRGWTQAVLRRRPAPWPDDRPYPQSPAGMTPRRWREALMRRLAGEPTPALAAEYGTSVSAFHYHAKTRGMRMKDHANAVRQPKGPPPVRVETGADGDRIVCAELAFRYDRHDVVATVEAIGERLEEAAIVGDTQAIDKLQRIEGRSLINSARLVKARAWRDAQRAARASVEDRADGPAAPEPEPDEIPGPAHVLREAQTPPQGDWRTWLFLGGRGAGKTLAGAEWLADQAQRLGRGGRLALIGPTLHDVREVMIEGASGLRSLPRWTGATRPIYAPSRRRLYFKNGCVAYAFSAEDPDSLRGPQFSAAWADEFCAWPAHGARGAAETLAMLRMGLRLPLVSCQAVEAPSTAFGGPVVVSASPTLPPPPVGEEAPSTAFGGPPPPLGEECGGVLPRRGRGTLRSRVEGAAPRLVITTTPKPSRALIRLREEAGCVVTHAPTAENAAHLASGFLDGLTALYGGTRREAQELEGKIVDLEGALFTAEMMMRARTPSEDDADRFERIVVAIDPPATATGDACGIIAAASRVRADGVREAVVLADRSAHGLTPDQWARRAVALAHEVGATRLVAEVNQGGDMVVSVLKTVDRPLPIRAVRATQGKRLRAEPVAALYEQGRVRHAGMFDALEEELMLVGAEAGEGSLDRADALVWAVTDLLVDRPGERGPRVRVL